MLICDNGVIREMTPEEIERYNNLPDPNQQITDTEALDILIGESNDN